MSEALEKFWQSNPASDEQMFRWLGCVAAYSEVVSYARSAANYLRERIRLTNPHWVRRRAALQERLDLYTELAAHFEDRLRSVQGCYKASELGRAALGKGDALSGKRRER